MSMSWVGGGPPGATASIGGSTTIVATKTFTSANADTGGIAIYTPTVAGLYRLSTMVLLTAVGAGVSGNFQVFVGTSGNNGNTATLATGPANFNGTAYQTFVQGSFPFWQIAGNAITYRVVFNAPANSPVVGYAFCLERLSS